MSEVDPWLDLALVPSPLSVLPSCHKLLCSSMYTPNHDALPAHGPQITSQQCTKIAELGATIQSLNFSQDSGHRNKSYDKYTIMCQY